MVSLVVLISGGGTNLQSIIDQVQRGTLDASIAAVISSRADAYGLRRAEKAGIPCETIVPGAYTTREAYDRALANVIHRYEAGLIVLAGFMRILGAEFVERFAGRMINIHPSLLPDYKGMNTHQRVIDAGETYHGATVHFVTSELDEGPVIIQARVKVGPDDDAGSLQQKVLEQEHIIYPKAIQGIASGRVSFDNARLQDEMIPG
ncbi:MAG: phosphoribosylglycinamide formyltransferase [Gammaproteobacteria bacterium]|nr:phosphoribosylglycinamide formyltransferase [Gammaproteobacteria bacterium]